MPEMSEVRTAIDGYIQMDDLQTGMRTLTSLTHLM